MGSHDRQERVFVICLVIAALVGGVLAIAAEGQDLDRDGFVGFDDFLAFARAYGTETPGSCLVGVWVQSSVSNGPEDVSHLFLFEAAFDGRYCSLRVDSVLGVIFARRGTYTTRDDNLIIRWQDGTTTSFRYRRQGQDLLLHIEPYEFEMMHPQSDLSRMK